MGQQFAPKPRHGHDNWLTGIADAVAVRVLLIGVRHVRAVVVDVQDAVAVAIRRIARIAAAIVVRVELVRVRNVRAVVRRVQNAIAVGIGVRAIWNTVVIRVAQCTGHATVVVLIPSAKVSVGAVAILAAVVDNAVDFRTGKRTVNRCAHVRKITAVRVGGELGTGRPGKQGQECRISDGDRGQPRRAARALTLRRDGGDNRAADTAHLVRQIAAVTRLECLERNARDDVASGRRVQHLDGACRLVDRRLGDRVGRGGARASRDMARRQRGEHKRDDGCGRGRPPHTARLIDNGQKTHRTLLMGDKSKKSIRSGGCASRPTCRGRARRQDTGSARWSWRPTGSRPWCCGDRHRSDWRP